MKSLMEYWPYAAGSLTVLVLMGLGVSMWWIVGGVAFLTFVSGQMERGDS